MNIACRIAADDEDWDAVIALLRTSFAFMEGRIDPPSSLAHWDARRCAEAADTGPVFIASENGAVVGCAFGAPKADALYLGKVAVEKRLRGRGVARTLIDLAGWEAARRGLTAFELETRIELTENHTAFAALGFAKTTETAHPGYDRPTSITMRRAVGVPLAPPFLTHAGKADQTARLATLVRETPELMSGLEAARSLGLAQARIASGAFYNAVWNILTGRTAMRGVKDLDLIYWDDDLSLEAEAAVIARAEAAFADRGLPPVEARNQARVPLWYEARFGSAYPPIQTADESLLYYASRHHAVAVRLEDDDTLSIHAPFGLDDMFSFRATPNPALANRESHEVKAKRSRRLWPEVEVVHWPVTPYAAIAAPCGDLACPDRVVRFDC